MAEQSTKVSKEQSAVDTPEGFIHHQFFNFGPYLAQFDLRPEFGQRLLEEGGGIEKVSFT